MWKVMISMAITLFFIRAIPAFLYIRNLYNYPKIIKFLNYIIFLTTGEIIYLTGFKDISFQKNEDIYQFLLNLSTLIVAGTYMRYTNSLNKSLGLALCIFILVYFFTINFGAAPNH